MLLMRLSGRGVDVFRFTVDTAAYAELTRSTAWRWRRAERLGLPPTRQYVGAGDDTLRLRGTIYPAERAGLGQLDTLRAAAAAGEPLRLVLGYAPAPPPPPPPGSQDLGRWVIERVEEIQRQTWQDGAPRRQDFRLRLAFYPEDDALDVEALPMASVAAAAVGRSVALREAVDGALLDARRIVAPVLEEGPDIDAVAPDLRRNAAIIDGIAQVWRRTLAGQVRARVERALPRLGRAGDLAATVLRSVDGDVLDGVVWRHYGRVAGGVEQVLAANPGLAALGPVLPPGTRIELPELRLPAAAAAAARLGGQ